MVRSGKFLAVLAAAGVSLGVAGAADAASELTIDLNSLTAKAVPTVLGDAFGTSFTGKVVLSDDATSVLSVIEIDGVTQTGIGLPIAMSAPGNSLAGEIELLNGTVQGGFFTLTVGTDLYSASIISGKGDVDTAVGSFGVYTIDGLTFAGQFSGPTFAGVDVSLWYDNQPLQGSFFNFAFTPNDAGVDTDVALELGVVVPTPAAAVVGLPLLMLAGAASRRRRA